VQGLAAWLHDGHGVAAGEEHLDALGGSVESIAAAKAGILKGGRPLVLAAQPHAAAEKVLLEAAARLGCEVTRAEEVVQVASRWVLQADCAAWLLLRTAPSA
jgi:folylpolyglutamate synthase/dihydropteroate synthase